MLSLNPLLFGVATRTTTIGVPDQPGIPWLRIAVALIVCIGIAVGMILLLRRFSGARLQEVLSGQIGAMRGKSEIEIIETRRASVHGQICLFHYQDMAYLVAVTAGGASLIDKVPVEQKEEIAA